MSESEDRASFGRQNPGRVRFSCMIWEPDPIPTRPLQEFSIVYNSITLSKLFQEEEGKAFRGLPVRVFDYPPYGMYLREKYVYRDTFLKIGNETLNSARPDMFAENKQPLFDSSGKPNFPYIEHQTFSLIGSLFETNNVTPTGIQQAGVESLDNGLSKWKIQEIEVPFEHDGHNDPTETSNLHDYVSDIKKYTYEADFAEELKKSKLSENDKNAILSRRTKRFIPIQVATSSDRKNLDGGSPGANLPKGVHWLCEKETPMFQSQDFFVEFFRTAESTDIVKSDANLQINFSEIDSMLPEAWAKWSNTNGSYYINSGVIDTDKDGNIIKESIQQYNLNNQAYYIVELGAYTSDHNYFILLPYNGFPTLIHRGTFLIESLEKVADFDQKTYPQIIKPKVKTSRKLSVYNVSCKELIDKLSLRMTVRNHYGKLIITFSGYENNPWIIERNDFTKETPTITDFDPSLSEEQFMAMVPAKDGSVKNVPMIVAEGLIKIGGGNIKAGFTYGPLHYVTEAGWNQPHVTTVKGPLKDKEISMLLTDPVKRKSAFQDAELYFEWDQNKLNTVMKYTDQQPFHPARGVQGAWCPHPIKDFRKDHIPLTKDVRNKNNLQLSYIAVYKTSNLKPVEKLSPGENITASIGEQKIGNTKIKEFLQEFDSSYYLRSGDSQIPSRRYDNNSSTPSSASSFFDYDKTYWRIWNCITPIANGWRLKIPQDNLLTSGHNQKPVEVAHHVERFNHTWSYSDNAKIEHSGTIRFNLNAGQALAFENNTSEPRLADQSAFLSALSNKIFFVRIYAWWEGGYMDCKNSGCPCRRPGGPGAGKTDKDRRCVFTGIGYCSDININGPVRYMECQLNDYMKILNDQFFINSPFYDGMSDYSALNQIVQMAGMSTQKLGKDPYSPCELINRVASYPSPPDNEFTMQDEITKEQQYYFEYTLPSAYDILQSPFFKFQDTSKYDEAISRIGAIASKVAYFDRFGRFRFDVRSDVLFQGKLSKEKATTPKCNFFSSPRQVTCSTLDMLSFDAYSYKKPINEMFNEIFLVGTSPEGALYVNSVLNYRGRYDPTSPGYIGYAKKFMQVEGIWGSEDAIRSIGNYYKNSMFNPPTIINWKSMGMANIQAMDIVTFSGLSDDRTFPEYNASKQDSTELPDKTVTLIITSLSGEIDAKRGTWENQYEGEWLYGEIK